MFIDCNISTAKAYDIRMWVEAYNYQDLETHR